MKSKAEANEISSGRYGWYKANELFDMVAAKIIHWGHPETKNTLTGSNVVRQRLFPASKRHVDPTGDICAQETRKRCR
jgi:hypothetical protein